MLVAEGHRYRLTAEGVWHDWHIASDAAGYQSPSRWLRMFECVRRRPRLPWFALVGSVDHRHPFLVGRESTITAPASGELACYANDLWPTYFNNHGAVTLTVTRIV